MQQLGCELAKTLALPVLSVSEASTKIGIPAALVAPRRGQSSSSATGLNAPRRRDESLTEIQSWEEASNWQLDEMNLYHGFTAEL